jgi:hypothetical protein
MDLLYVIEKDIMPRLDQESSSIRLKEFLENARKTKGRSFLPFFK